MNDLSYYILLKENSLDHQQAVLGKLYESTIERLLNPFTIIFPKGTGTATFRG